MRIVLIEEPSSEVMRLCAWALREEGFDDVTVSPKADGRYRLEADSPRVVITNTPLDYAADTRLIDVLRGLSPVSTAVITLTSSEGAAAGVALSPPHTVSKLVDLIHQLAATKD